jgi:hypothetical protein
MPPIQAGLEAIAPAASAKGVVIEAVLSRP